MGYDHSVYALWFTVCMGRDSLCVVYAWVIFITIAVVMLLREFDTLVQTKANLCHMLSGKAVFAVEIININATRKVHKVIDFRT